MPVRILIAIGLLASSPSTAQPGEILGTPHLPGGALEQAERYGNIRLLASLRLPRVDYRSLPLTGLSGLAWSEDDNILYALSDLGYLFHLQPVFNAGHLHGIRIIDAYPLRKSHDRPLPLEASNSEGLALVYGNNGIHGDDELIICFEGRPRIARYRPHGLLLTTEQLPDRLAITENYDSPNRGLESVAIHPRFGLITAAERPLKPDGQDRFTLYSLAGQTWTFAPVDPIYGAITDITTAPDGSLLILERIFSGIFGTVATVIHRAGLHSSGLSAKTVVRLDRDYGHLIDNFEGLTHHRDNRYFMISDDNRHPLQQILLFYFEIVE